jgi:hypothetical protein
MMTTTILYITQYYLQRVKLLFASEELGEEPLGPVEALNGDKIESVQSAILLWLSAKRPDEHFGERQMQLTLNENVLDPNAILMDLQIESGTVLRLNFMEE